MVSGPQFSDNVRDQNQISSCTEKERPTPSFTGDDEQIYVLVGGSLE